MEIFERMDVLGDTWVHVEYMQCLEKVVAL